MLRETAGEKESEVHRRQNVNCERKFSLDVCSVAYVQASNTLYTNSYRNTALNVYVRSFFAAVLVLNIVKQ